MSDPPAEAVASADELFASALAITEPPETSSVSAQARAAVRAAIRICLGHDKYCVVRIYSPVAVSVVTAASKWGVRALEQHQFSMSLTWLTIYLREHRSRSQLVGGAPSFRDAADEHGKGVG
jgi:hypothetical protein